MEPHPSGNPLQPPPVNVTPVNSVVPDVLKNAPRVNPLSENSKLMHPVEDMSLVCTLAVSSPVA